MKKLIVAFCFCIGTFYLPAQNYFSVNSGIGFYKPFKESAASYQSSGINFTLPVNFEYYSKKGFRFSAGISYLQEKGTLEYGDVRCITGPCIHPNVDDFTSSYAGLNFSLAYNVLKKSKHFQLFPYFGFSYQRAIKYQVVSHYEFSESIKTTSTPNLYNMELKTGMDIRYVFKKMYLETGMYVTEESFEWEKYPLAIDIGVQFSVGYILNR
jgi:hypothetical protein